LATVKVDASVKTSWICWRSTCGSIMPCMDARDGWRDHWPESHGGDRIKFERGKFSYVARQQSDGACPVSHQVSGGTQ
jgi:hypothetical protein